MPPASKPPADPDRGRRIGKYEIITRLSIGGMAELFLAFLPGPGGFKKFVALKQILPDVKADDSFVKMFLDEARITAALTHANIGQVFDLGEDPASGELYLAMEFISGQNLEQVIKRAAKLGVAIPVGFAARVVHDACLGLHSAHAFTDPTGRPMAVVHRDVSPKNVMITWGGQVKVIDFGIAKARGRLNRTQVGIVRGTSGYMSPEQVKNAALDGRTDLFAAAVILHELLAGERLFTAPTDAAMMIKIAEGETPPLAEAHEHVSAALSDVVAKGLAKAREQRWATGKEFARALQQACPELFDDEQLAEFMAQLFPDKIAITRSLLEAANAGGDQAQVSQAAQGLTSSEPDLEPAKKRPEGARPRTATGAGGKAPPRTATGVQKAPPRAPTRESARATPGPKASRPPARAGTASIEVDVQEPTPRPAARPPPASRDDGDSTIPPRSRSARKLAQVEEAAPATTAPEPPAPRKPARLGALLALVVVVAVVGGLGWAVTVGPLAGAAAQALAEERPPPIDTGPRPVEVGTSAPASDKPAWLREKEAQEAVLTAERQRLEEAEAAANDPERVKLLEELQAQLQQLNALEEEQRQLKLEAKQGRVAGEANTRKIQDLQSQIDDLKKLVAARQQRGAAGTKGAAGAPGEVAVVRDARTAKQAEVGYLTLRTVNPSSVAVTLDGATLGSTPLVKVPLDVGTHRLIVIDGEATSRLLSVTIEPGKTAEFKGVDVGSLPRAQ